MKIGDLVTWSGRLWWLCGIDPMSVDQRQADLEDVQTGTHLWAPLEEVEEADERRFGEEPLR
jgi:hypothetical protein